MTTTRENQDQQVLEQNQPTIQPSKEETTQHFRWVRENWKKVGKWVVVAVVVLIAVVLAVNYAKATGAPKLSDRDIFEVVDVNEVGSPTAWEVIVEIAATKKMVKSPRDTGEGEGSIQVEDPEYRVLFSLRIPKDDLEKVKNLRQIGFDDPKKSLNVNGFQKIRGRDHLLVTMKPGAELVLWKTN